MCRVLNVSLYYNSPELKHRIVWLLVWKSVVCFKDVRFDSCVDWTLALPGLFIGGYFQRMIQRWSESQSNVIDLTKIPSVVRKSASRCGLCAAHCCGDMTDRTWHGDFRINIRYSRGEFVVGQMRWLTTGTVTLCLGHISVCQSPWLLERGVCPNYIRLHCYSESVSVCSYGTDRFVICRWRKLAWCVCHRFLAPCCFAFPVVGGVHCDHLRAWKWQLSV